MHYICFQICASLIIAVYQFVSIDFGRARRKKANIILIEKHILVDLSYKANSMAWHVIHEIHELLNLNKYTRSITFLNLQMARQLVFHFF